MSHCEGRHCGKCLTNQSGSPGAPENFFRKEGEILVGLIGNPNTGKSTLFNALTGLRQHTGNWPGKTVSLAQGSFRTKENKVRLVDLPGTYTLEGLSTDEEVTDDFLKLAGADLNIVVVDASALERNLALVFQILARTRRIIVALNLMDEARGRGLVIDEEKLATALGVPVIGMSARRGEGIQKLKEEIDEYQSTFRETEALSTEESLTPLEAYRKAGETYADVVRKTGKDGRSWQESFDRWLTHPLTGLPLMGLILALVLWLTITGANVPSQFLSDLLIGKGQPFLHGLLKPMGMPNWVLGLLIDGVYLTVAWVVSVMLPPMAIFFPLFTLLEDFGYLPRVAFNMDGLFQKSGAHGKQALTMAMGYGCNAAGVIACRIIESPRERLIAIVTNNFSLCNGRWPTQMLLATIFLGSMVPAAWAGLTAATAVMGIFLLGILLTFLSSAILSRSLLRGKSSTFSLELPPFRTPRFFQTLYTSLIDRTMFVLWRAVVFAAPAGAVIWLLANIHWAGNPVALYLIDWLDTPGGWMGLNGVILLAYIIAIPANEIVIPTVMMLTALVLNSTAGPGAGILFEWDDGSSIRTFLHSAGWTAATAVSLMLFSLAHNPCSTTLYTIYKETGSARWTAFSALFPTITGVVLCVGFTLLVHFL